VVYTGVEGRFISAVATAASGKTLLGMAVCADGLGQNAQHSEDHRLLCQPEHSISFGECALRLRAGVLWGRPADLWFRITFHRTIALAENMLVAYLTADHEAFVSFFSEPDKFYVADPCTFLFASLMVLIFGAGLFSADTLVRNSLKDKLA
jgi:hypothetical protein